MNDRPKRLLFRRSDGYIKDPVAADGRKVMIVDTDHGYGWTALKKDGPARQQAWVWKNLLRGNQTLFMDPYDGAVLGNRFDPQWEPIRRNLGHALRLARRWDLAAMVPHDELAREVEAEPVALGVLVARPAEVGTRAGHDYRRPSGGFTRQSARHA